MSIDLRWFDDGPDDRGYVCEVRLSGESDYDPIDPDAKGAPEAICRAALMLAERIKTDD